MEQPQQKEPSPRVVPMRCDWHPEVETGLSCSKCGKHVCTQCMVQAPVGIRCRECGKAVKMPTFDVTPSFYARAAGVAVLMVVGGGLLWAGFTLVFGSIFYLPSLVAIGVGYATGELISLVVNRKRSNGLAWIAGSTVVGASLVSWVVGDLRVDGIFSLLFIFLGVMVAVQRVR